MRYRQAMKLLKKTGPSRYWRYAFMRAYKGGALFLTEEVAPCIRNANAQPAPVREALKRKHLRLLARDERCYARAFGC